MIEVNGLKGRYDVINGIVDAIDDGNLDLAKDMLFQLRTQEEVKEISND